MNNKRLVGLPYKVVKRIISQELGGQQVSSESVEYMISVLESQLKEYCKEAIIKQEEENKIRVIQGLPPKRRFEVSLFKSFVESRINTPTVVYRLGDEGQTTNRDTSSSSRKELSQ